MPQSPSIWSRDFGLWASFAALAALYAFDIALMASSGRLDKSASSGTIGWTAILFAYAWRKLGRSGWAGFFIGLAFGIVALPLLLLLVNIYRAAG